MVDMWLMKDCACLKYCSFYNLFAWGFVYVFVFVQFACVSACLHVCIGQQKVPQGLLIGSPACTPFHFMSEHSFRWWPVLPAPLCDHWKFIEVKSTRNVCSDIIYFIKVGLMLHQSSAYASCVHIPFERERTSRLQHSEACLHRDISQTSVRLAISKTHNYQQKHKSLRRHWFN